MWHGRLARGERTRSSRRYFGDSEKNCFIDGVPSIAAAYRTHGRDGRATFVGQLTNISNDKVLVAGYIITTINGYGKGVYIYNAYAFYRELPEGVPGAFRLFANMISLPKNPSLGTAGGN